jgi:hypothetical protein
MLCNALELLVVISFANGAIVKCLFKELEQLRRAQIDN